jgi:hypothetical protein
MALSKALLTAVALGAAAVAPSAAHAAEGFTGVTAGGDVVQFHSDSAPGVRHAPKQVTGLAAGETIVGLDRAPSGELLALTSAGNVAALDTATGKAVVKFPAPVTGPVDANAAVTFAVAPNGAAARILTAGRDVTVDLATGKTTAGPGLTFAAGDHHAGAQAAPALDYEADGRLIGVDAGQAAVAVQTAVGASTLGTLSGLPFKAVEPLRSTVASNGTVWTAARLSSTSRQSRFVSYDPVTGRISDTNGAYLGIELAAVAADGAVADDKTKPNATISGKVLHRHVVRGGSVYTGLRVKSDEAGQTLVSLRLGGKVVGMDLGTRYTPGTISLQFGARRGEAVALRKAAAAHRRALVHVTVHDWAGNKRVYDHAVRLSL